MEVTAAVTVAATIVEVTAAVTVAAIIMEVTAAVTAAAIIEAVTAAILNLIPHIIINPLEQRVGKIEVMVILLKTLNMKLAELEEKGGFPVRLIPQMRKISNPFLQAFELI